MDCFPASVSKEKIDDSTKTATPLVRRKTILNPIYLEHL